MRPTRILNPARGCATILCALSLVATPPVALAQVRVERRVVGDTSIVRTIGVEPPAATRKLVPVFSFGRETGPEEYVFGRIYVRLGGDGSVWVFDQSVPMLRQYDSTGRYVKKVGRGGDGPGEYQRTMAFAPLRTGGVLIKSSALDRINRYGPSGAYVDAVSISGSSGLADATLSSSALVLDTADRVFVQIVVGSRPNPTGGTRPFPISAMARLGPDGQLRDTVRVPSFGLVTPWIRTPNSGVGLPYWPQEFWSFSRLGYFVGARADRYQIDILAGRGRTIRIERAIPPVPLTNAEREPLRDNIIEWRRGSDPLWTWTGPDVPRVKPFFRNMFTDDDGRIWVHLHTPSERVPDTGRQAAPPQRGRGAARPTFREADVYEVFAADGAYLGRVAMPSSNTPRIRGNTVWMPTVDSNDVPVVTKFRIDPPLAR